MKPRTSVALLFSALCRSEFSAESSQSKAFTTLTRSGPTHLWSEPGLQLCLALMAPSHGQAHSIQICFSNSGTRVPNSYLNPLVGISPDFLFFFFVFWLVLFSLGWLGFGRNPLVFAEIISGCPLLLWLICGSHSQHCVALFACAWTRRDFVWLFHPKITPSSMFQIREMWFHWFLVGGHQVDVNQQ